MQASINIFDPRIKGSHQLVGGRITIDMYPTMVDFTLFFGTSGKDSLKLLGEFIEDLQAEYEKYKPSEEK